MKIWILGLEALETRYTGEWYPQFAEVLEESGIEFEFILGSRVTMNLESKFFLDPVGTNIWKCSQMEKMLRRFDEVKDGDVIFTWDFWHPGLECLAYARSFLGKKFFLAGIAHSGTYDPWDLTHQLGMEEYGKSFEEGWLNILDKIFVATDYHRRLILGARNVDPKKLVITGLPVDIKHLFSFRTPWEERLNQIIFTGRKSKEKGYDLVLNLKEKGLPIVVALDYGLSKKAYHELLGSSKVVFAPSQQETFGYGVVEGICAGCIPVVPDRLSFQDYVISEYRYDDDYLEPETIAPFELKAALQSTACVNRKQLELVQWYDYKSVVFRMIVEMEKLGG